MSDNEWSGQSLTTGREAPQASQTGGRCRSSLLRNGSIQHLLGFMIQIAKTVGLDSIGDDRKQQMPRQMSRGRPPEDALPARAQSSEVETAQMRDLALIRRF